MITEGTLRIGLVAPPYIPIKTKINGYGGTERVISDLISSFIRKGHDVILFAPEGSRTPARLISTGRPLWADNYTLTGREEQEGIERTLELAYIHKNDVDILHFHIDEGLADPRFRGIPIVTTLHDGKYVLDSIESKRFNIFEDSPIVFISNDQRFLLPEAKATSVVYNGLDPNRYTYSHEPGKYLAFLGRISPEKGVHVALDAAWVTKTPLFAMYRKPAVNKSDPIANAEWKYYEEQIQPRFEEYGNLVTHFIDVQRDIIIRNLAGALATIGPSGFPPSLWREPFGLFVIESMACGTPVIAYAKGGPNEIVIHGETGYLASASDPNKAFEETVSFIDKIRKGGSKLREASRRRVEEHFTSEIMADGYERVYRSIINGLRRE
jgi:glycosyltransferase involved in cell wall biosynthesis